MNLALEISMAKQNSQHWEGALFMIAFIAKILKE